MDFRCYIQAFSTDISYFVPPCVGILRKFPRSPLGCSKSLKQSVSCSFPSASHPTSNWHKLSHLIVCFSVFLLYVVWKRGLPRKFHVLSCFVHVKSVPFNLLCVSDSRSKSRIFVNSTVNFYYGNLLSKLLNIILISGSDTHLCTHKRYSYI